MRLIGYSALRAVLFCGAFSAACTDIPYRGPAILTEGAQPIAQPSRGHLTNVIRALDEHLVARTTALVRPPIRAKGQLSFIGARLAGALPDFPSPVYVSCRNASGTDEN